MKSIRDYLNLDDSERRFLEMWDKLPTEVIPYFEKMLFGNSADFEEAEKALRAYVEERQKSEKQ